MVMWHLIGVSVLGMYPLSDGLVSVNGRRKEMANLSVRFCNFPFFTRSLRFQFNTFFLPLERNQLLSGLIFKSLMFCKAPVLVFS